MEISTVSIILPTYNRAEYLAGAIDSVLAQTYENFELIIVDDESTDNTGEILQKFLTDKRVKYLKKEKSGKGWAATRNYVMRFATGKYIAFLDSDDFWLPEKLEAQVGILEDNKADLVYSAFIVGNGEKRSFIYDRVKEGILHGKRLFDNLLFTTIFPHPSTIILRRDESVFGFYENMQAAADHLFYLELALVGYKFYSLKKPLVHVTVNHNQMTDDKIFLFK